MNYNTSNPVLSARNFSVISSGQATTLQGTINRCLILLALVFLGAAFSWASVGSNASAVAEKLVLFTVLAIVTYIVTCFKKEWSGVTAPLYAIFEGLVLGALSRLIESAYHGIVCNAVLLTFATAFAMLFVYKTKIIEVADKFRLILFSATLGICIVYLLSFVLSFFGTGLPMIHSSGVVGIAFSGFVVAIAALCLLSSFDFIVQVSNRGLPVYMSWFAAFGLMVTLIWLYVEILNLLSKIRSR
jgi:uncharacterized YccA/Bax inhibitor family protein